MSATGMGRVSTNRPRRAEMELAKAAQPNARRKPLRQIEFDTSESENGAWGEDKAPLPLITEFLGCVMQEDYEAAFTLSEQILKCDPGNEIIQQYQPVLQAKLK